MAGFQEIDTTGNESRDLTDGKIREMLREIFAGDVSIADKPEIAALTAVATADGSDAATTQALANALKVKVNAIIAALKA